VHKTTLCAVLRAVQVIKVRDAYVYAYIIIKNVLMMKKWLKK